MRPPHSLPTVEEDNWATAEALLAGTLALMTGCAHGAEEHRDMLSAKIVRNLGQLSEHSALSHEMRRVLARLTARWQPPGLPLDGHPAPATLQ